MNAFIILAFAGLIQCGTAQALQSKTANINHSLKNLYRQLMADYQKEIRPMQNPNSATRVFVSPFLYSLLDVIENEEIVIFSRWFQMFWNDPALQWNPKDYGGTDELLIDATKIWVPDITIIEQLRLTNADTRMDFASLLSNGTVRYSLNDIVEIHCPIDSTHFPFDKQNCSISYVSWEYPADQIEVYASHEDPSHYKEFYHENSEWKQTSYSYEYIVISNGGSISFDACRFWLGIERKPTYYTVALAAPSYMIVMLCLTGLFSPSQSIHVRQQRVSVGLSGILAIAVLLTIVVNLMPKSDKFPKLGVLIVSHMVVTGVATGIAALVMYIHSIFALNQWSFCLKRHRTTNSPNSDRYSANAQCSQDPVTSISMSIVLSEPPMNVDPVSSYEQQTLHLICASAKHIERDLRQLNSTIQQCDRNESEARRLAVCFTYIDIALLMVFCTATTVISILYIRSRS